MDWVILLYIAGVIIPWLNTVYLIYVSIDSYSFSNNVLKKIIVKENSKLRKIIPFKESYIYKKTKIVGYRYLIYPYAFYLLFQTIFLIVSLILLIIDYFFIPFISKTTILIIILIAITTQVLFVIYMEKLAHKH
ncbi:MAG: hypothetical protein ACOX02_00950 [Acholeplasmatales bacterium]